MGTIVIFSLENINNAGEELLGTTTEWIIKQVDSERHQIKRIQFYPKWQDMPYKYKIDFFIGNIFKWISLRLKGKDLEYKLRNLCYILQYKRYFMEEIKNASYIIYAIGMLKYSTQNFSYIYKLINTIASKYNIPVLMSAMSIEKRNDKDWRFHQLVGAVNMPCVKMITTRDGNDGLARLHKDYIHQHNICTDFVGDPALWIPEVYNIKKMIHNDNKKKVVGIGLIRKGIYNDYHEENFSDEQMQNLYVEIITELECRGYDWFLFCNGIKSDMSFGEKLLLDYSLPKTKLLSAPRSAEELLKIIINCDAIFGARLHACISSVALGIPVVGLLWDNKLDYFSRTMGIRQFFLSAMDLSGQNVVDKLESAMNYQFDQKSRDLYKQKTKECINLFMKNHHVK